MNTITPIYDDSTDRYYYWSHENGWIIKRWIGLTEILAMVRAVS